MKKLFALVVMFLLPWTAWADAPPAFAPELFNAAPADFARACEEALADTSLAGSVVAEKDGVPVVDWSEYYAFAVMRRTDGLLMLCHFTPTGDTLQLELHNDLLLSHDQDITLTMQGAAWSGGFLPEMRMMESFKFTICLCQREGTRLNLVADYDRDGWRISEMMLGVQMSGGSWHTALHLPADCLADDIYLATCKPDDWRRGEREEDVQYGW